MALTKNARKEKLDEQGALAELSYEERIVKEKLEGLRKKLLDLSGRNALLNFRHSEKAKTHVRIIDELPDFMFGKLLDGEKLSFQPLPKLDNEPYDEKSKHFQSAFRRATLTDELYLQEIEAIANKEDAFDEIAQIERRLKNRVREQLGLPPKEDLKPLSNAEWARQNGLEPKYDMPLPQKQSADKMSDKHADDWIQTLLLSKELQQKLAGLKRYINTDINETGVNTFYAAFGFLQWYDQENADKAYSAPLILMQLDPLSERKTKTGEIYYSMQSSGEEPQYNLPLSERLKQMGLQLPQLDGQDTPESYMRKVEQLIKNKNNWRVRRWITVGRFQFARLVMYKDLDPNSWPKERAINVNPLIKTLLSGQTNPGSGSGEVEAYDIDRDPAVEKAVPLLITEADSSQHSAIVDVLQGKNLVIKGPPGTGKSQTITNLIANALAKQNKVLFIAEKMAALDVVYSRLKHAGLEDFCLELHSTKTKLKDIRDNLGKAIDNRNTPQRPRQLKEKIDELNKVKAHLRHYSDMLNQPLGNMGKTVHDILWAEQARRNTIQSLPASIKKIRVKKADLLTQTELQGLCEELTQFAELAAENAKYDKASHPWKGIGLSMINSLKIGEIIQAAEETLEALSRLADELQEFEERHSWKVGRNVNQLGKTKEAWDDLRRLREQANVIDFTLLERLRHQEAILAAHQLATKLSSYASYLQKAQKIFKNPEKAIAEQEQIEAICRKAQSLGIANYTAARTKEHVAQLAENLKHWQGLEPKVTFVIWKLLGKENPNVKDIQLMLEVLGLLERISRNTLIYRNKDALDEVNTPIIEQAIEKLKNLNARQEKLHPVLDLKFAISDSELDLVIFELSNAGIFSYFKSGFRKAKKTYKTLCLHQEKQSYPSAVQLLRELKQYREEHAAFESDSRYKSIAGAFFEGVHTDFSHFQQINAWAKDVKKALSSGMDIDKDKAKQFLMQADIADIDAILEHISELKSEILRKVLEDVEEQEKAYKQHMTDMAMVIENGGMLAIFLEHVDATGNSSFKDIQNAVAGTLRHLSAMISDIEDDQVAYEQHFGTFYQGRATHADVLKGTAGLAEKIMPLQAQVGEKTALYSDRIFVLADQYCEHLAGIAANAQKFKDCLTAFREIGALDLDNYVGTKKIEHTIFADIKPVLEASLADKKSLNTLVKCNEFLENGRKKPYAELLKALPDYQINYNNISRLFEYLTYRTLADAALQSNKILHEQGLLSLDQIRKKFQELDRNIIKMQCQDLAYQLYKTPLAEGQSHGYVSDYSEMGLIRHQVQGRARQIPLRRFIEKAGTALQSLKPCFLMSPLSVAQYISPTSVTFDLIVIDEASQMCPEEALGAIARGGQIVVVGDPQQLPPTDFFQKQGGGADDDYDEEDRDGVTNESILDMALDRYFPPRELLWHYRSRHESLIAYSNKHFYNNRLVIFPSPENSSNHFGVTSRYVGSVYNASCNIGEAKAVVEAARQFMRDNPDKSLGIATMNSRQRDLIDEEMYRLFLDDKDADAYRTKWTGTLEPFFVKNLESVQGDERDTIFISTVYGPSKEGGAPAQRFGPINGKYGHRRLNVLFTRAKHNLVLFTSLKPDQINANEGSRQGLRTFKGYLEYAETGKLDTGIDTGRGLDSDFEAWVKSRLESRGYEVVPQIGVGGYFIDLGIKHPDYPYGYLLGIECDGAAYHSSKSARDRDRIRQEVLEGLGWTIYRIWSTEWFHNTDQEFERLLAFIEKTYKEKTAKRLEDEKKRLVFISQFREAVQPILFTSESVQSGAPERSENTVHIAPPQAKLLRYKAVEVFDTVTYEFLDSDKKETKTITLVTSQSDVNMGHINQHSAIGRALLGSALGEEVDIELPNGCRPVLIRDIKKYKAETELEEEEI